MGWHAQKQSYTRQAFLGDVPVGKDEARVGRFAHLITEEKRVRGDLWDMQGEDGRESK